MYKRICLALLFATLPFQTVLAHQPNISGTDTNITINEPEISKVYYGHLNGRSVIYTIISDRPFSFYIQLLTPSSDNLQTILSAKIIDDKNQLIYILDGSKFNWEPFYEPFGGDNYYKGPEYSSQLTGGKYSIEIFSQNNYGPYSIAIGQTEHFSLQEIITTLQILPSLKRDFFQEPWWRILINPFYIGLIIIGLIILIIIYYLIRIKIIHYRAQRIP